MGKLALGSVTAILATAAIVGCGGGDKAAQPGPAAGTAATTTPATTGPAAADAAARPKRSKTSKHRSTRSSTRAAASTSSSSGGGDRSIQRFGTKAAPSDEAAIAAAVLAYQRAVADRDGAAACDAMASEIRTQLMQMLARAPKGKGASCGRALIAMFGNVPAPIREALRGTKVTGVRIEGDRAFALFSRPGLRSGFFPVMREHGSWKVAAISGASLP